MLDTPKRMFVRRGVARYRRRLLPPDLSRLSQRRRGVRSESHKPRPSGRAGRGQRTAGRLRAHRRGVGRRRRRRHHLSRPEPGTACRVDQQRLRRPTHRGQPARDQGVRLRRPLLPGSLLRGRQRINGCRQARPGMEAPTGCAAAGLSRPCAARAWRSPPVRISACRSAQTRTGVSSPATSGPESRRTAESRPGSTSSSRSPTGPSRWRPAMGGTRSSCPLENGTSGPPTAGHACSASPCREPVANIKT